MIDVKDISMCCGCTACVAACPAGCITMHRDSEGFDYPEIDMNHCLECGKCEEVCPMNGHGQPRTPLGVFAARSDAYVDRSSSGGIFPVLAHKVISEGGVVCGAVLGDRMKVFHKIADNHKDVVPMMGSKYVQSELGGAFSEIESYLKAGKTVLFSGTPCQAAGLRRFLGTNYGSLIIVDFACHGVPSPGLWSKYLDALQHRTGKPAETVVFRDKSRGWRHYHFIYNDVSVPYVEDPYMALFLQDMTLRPSCYECRLRNGCSGSDITLADLWNVAEAAPGLNDDRGVSAVIVNTDVGVRLMEDAGSDVELYPVELSSAVRCNGGFAGSVPIPSNRSEFFDGMGHADDLYAYMQSYVVRKSWVKRIGRKVRRTLSVFKRRIIK